MQYTPIAQADDWYRERNPTRFSGSGRGGGVSARPEPRELVDSAGDPTLTDSDEDASLVVSHSREQVFASFVEAVDHCEEFELTIVDDLEESFVEVRCSTYCSGSCHNSLSASLWDVCDGERGT